MTLKECYETLGGSYDDVVTRLMNESFVKRIIGKFLEDKSVEELKAAYENNDGGAAFQAVHTLKGLALNLGFPKLVERSSDLTEELRNGDISGTEEKYEKLIAEYNNTVDILKKID